MRHTQLRAFHHVALTGGFSRAARALGLTQPAISDQVRSLESEYDIGLFDRGKRQVALTPDGEHLLEITLRLFDAESQALDLLSESLALQSGRLRIMADATRHILDVLTRFRALYPKVFVSVREGNSVEVVERLKTYDAEIGVMGDPPDEHKLDAVSLGATPIIAFASRDHPIARDPGISLAALLRHPLVLRERGSKTRAILEQCAAERGLDITIGLEADGREAVREIVATGGGVGVVSQAEFSDEPRLVAVPITDTDISMAESVVCLRERADSRLIRTFMAMVRAATAD